MVSVINESRRSLYNKHSESINKGNNDDLVDEAKTRFEEYIKRINVMNDATHQAEQNRVEEWQRFSRQFLNTLFFDVLEDFGLSDIPVQFVLCGSLAREQATPYSDVDALVIVKNQTDVEKIKEAMEGFNTLLTRIFNAKAQFFGNPAGLNMANFCGTVEDLIDIMDKHAAKDAYIVSALSSRRQISISEMSLIGFKTRYNLI
jgi:effector protein DrrA/SidM